MRTTAKRAALAAVLLTAAACGGQEAMDAAAPVSPTAANLLTMAPTSIYADALGSGWQDWSWATVNLANSSPVAAGTASIAITYGPWTGLYLHSTSGASTAGYSYLEFQINGGATASPALTAAAVIGSTQGVKVRVAQYCTGGVIPANAWTLCRVPLSALGAANATVSGIQLQEAAGKTLPVLYVDSVAFTAPATVSVAVTPATASVTAGASQTFTATVSNSTSTAVTWSVQEGSAGGSITTAGAYTAPATAGTYHVKATSQADATQSATATVTVTAPAPAPAPAPAVSVSVAPSTASALTGGSLSFSATVANASNQAVTWTVVEGSTGGSVTSTGAYTAPATAGTYHVKATSQADTTKSATATVTVTAPAPSASTGTWIYRDALVSPWQDWSWAADNLAATSPVYAGTSSISATMGAWQAVYFSTSGFSTTGHTNLSLAVNGGTGSGALVQVRALVNGTWTTGTALGPTCSGGKIPANAWALCTVPLSAIAPAGATVTGIEFQEFSGATLPTMYFDEVGIDVTATVPAPTPAPTPTPTPTAVAISVTPATTSVLASGSTTFSASVTGTTNTSVAWTVQEGAAGGAVSSTGTYTAPSAAGTYHVVATSQADTTKTAIATVTVTSASSSTGGKYTLPSDRGTTWKPGVTYNGGIPSAAWPVASTVSCSNGTGDLTTIQNAINSAHSAYPNGAVVKINAGTCNLDSGVISLPSNTVLRGAGAGATLLTCTNGATDNSYQPGARGYFPLIQAGGASYGTSINLASDAAHDGNNPNYSVTVTSTSGLSAGQYVLLDELSGATWQTDPQGMGQILASPDWRVVWQLHNPGLQTDDPIAFSGGKIGNGSDAASWFCRQDRPQDEIKQIASISGNTVTFTTPVHISYRAGHQAQLTPYSGIVVHAGVEALSMSHGSNGNLRFEGCAECWAKNVESSHWLNEGIAVNNSFRVEVRDSYLHEGAWPVPGGGGYALSLGWGTSEFLLENSISFNSCKNMVARASGAGSVIGYNYFDAPYDGGNTSWVEVSANASHMVGPHHVLFEGNYAPNFDSDKTHGNSTYMVTFRNWFRGIRRPFTDLTTGASANDATNGSIGPARTYGPAAFGYWMSAVGNVLGAQGKMSGWVYQDTANGVMTSGTKAIFALGWDDWVSAYPNVKPDPNVSSGARGILRDGNWDWVTASQKWDTTPTALPSSMYLPGKPTFFGSNTWPWVNPVNGSTGAVPDPQSFGIGNTPGDTLPALARYLAGTPNTVP